MRARSVLVLLSLVVAGIAATTTWYARYHYDPTAGPIDGSHNGLSYSQPLDVRQDFSIGITTLYNRGQTPVVVDRVRLLGVTGSLEVSGVNTRTWPQDGGEQLIGDFGFPPARYASKPLSEQNVVPVAKQFDKATGTALEGLELVIGIRAMEPGIAAYRAVEVRYRAGRRHYREVFEANAVHLCAPLSDFVDSTPPVNRTIRDCPPRELEDKFEDRVLDWPPPSASKNAARP